MRPFRPKEAPAQDEAWKEALKGVKRIKRTEEPPTKPLVINPPVERVDYQAAYAGEMLSPLDIGTTDNIDRRTAEKFKRGEFAIEKTLDLHGYKEKDAYESVVSFIKQAYLQKCRCVLIITGKGLHKEEEDWFEVRGILRNSVPQWLNTPDLRPLILSFSYAQPADGGEGALYVLLRRKRRQSIK